MWWFGLATTMLIVTGSNPGATPPPEQTPCDAQVDVASYDSGLPGIYYRLTSHEPSTLGQTHHRLSIRAISNGGGLGGSVALVPSIG